jgi:spore germination protein (amino acid permease)
MKNNIEITPMQLSFTIMQAMFGVGYVSLPHNLQEVAKGGGFLSVLFAGVLVQILLIILWALNKRFPTKTLFEFAPVILGRFFGTAVSLLYIIYFLLTSSLVLDLYTRINKEWAYPLTPGWLLMLLMVFTSIYLVISELRVMARFLVFVSFLLIANLFLAIWGLQNANYLYILPIDEAGWINIAKAMHDSVIGMLGFELILVAYPFTEGTDKDKLKAVSFALWVIVFLYTLITFTCLVVYSPEEIPLISEPVIHLLKAYRLPMIERLDLFYLLLNAIAAATSYMVYLYMSTKGISSLFKRVKYKWAIWPAAAISFVIALFPENRYQIMQFSKILSFVSYLFIFALPVFLLIVALIRKQKEEGVNM